MLTLFLFSFSSDISCTPLTVVVQKEEYSTSLLRVCGLVFAVCLHHWVCCDRRLLWHGASKHQVSSVAVFIMCVIRAGCVHHTTTQGTNKRYIKQLLKDDIKLLRQGDRYIELNSTVSGFKVKHIPLRVREEKNTSYKGQSPTSLK